MMDSELEEGEIEDNSSDEETVSTASPASKLNKDTNGLIQQESQKVSVFQQEGLNVTSPREESNHGPSRKRSLSPLLHPRRDCANKWNVVESRSQESQSRIDSSVHRYHPGDSRRQEVNWIETPWRTETWRSRNSRYSTKNCVNPFTKAIKQEIDQIAKPLTKIAEISIVTRHETNTEMGKKGLPTQLMPNDSIITPPLLPETTQNSNHGIVDPNSSDESNSTDFTDDEKNSEEASTECGVEELEQRRMDLMALINSLEQKEVKNHDTASEELREPLNIKMELPSVSPEAKFPLATQDTSLSIQNDITDLRLCAQDFSTPIKIDANQRMSLSEISDSQLKIEASDKSSQINSTESTGEHLRQNILEPRPYDFNSKVTRNENPLTLNSPRLIPSSPLLTPSNQTANNNCNAARNFEYEKACQNPPCYSKQVFKSPKRNCAEFSDDMTNDINSLNRRIVSVLPTRNKHHDISGNSVQEDVDERSHLLCTPKQNLLEAPLTSPSLPDLRLNLNARYNRYATAALQNFTSPTAVSPNVDDAVHLTPQPEIRSSCVRRVHFSPVIDKNPCRTFIRSSGIPVAFASNAKAYVQSRQPHATKDIHSNSPFKNKQTPDLMTFKVNIRQDIPNDLNSNVIPLVESNSTELYKSSNSSVPENCSNSSELEKSSNFSPNKIPPILGLKSLNSNPSTVFLPTNFDVALNAMLKSARKTVEAKAGKTKSIEIIQESDISRSDRGIQKAEPSQKKIISISRKILTPSKKLPEDSVEALVGDIVDSTICQTAKDNMATKKELELREKLLKATLVRNMGMSHLKLQLATTENKLIRSRVAASEMFLKLNSSMANYKDKKIHLHELSEKMEKLKTETESVGKQMQITKNSVNIMAEEVIQSTKVAFAMENTCTELTKICTDLGVKVMGQHYKKPSQGEQEMKENVKLVRDQSYSMKKYNEKYKQMENNVPSVLDCTRNVPSSSRSSVGTFEVTKEINPPNSSPGKRRVCPSLSLQGQKYRIDVEPREKRKVPIQILTDIHFIDVMTPEKESTEKVAFVHNISEEFKEYASLSFGLCP